MAVVNTDKAVVKFEAEAVGLDEAKKLREEQRMQREAQKEQLRLEKELAAAEAQQKSRIAGVGSAMQAFTVAVKDSNANLGQFSHSLSGIAALFGPWGLAIGGVVALLGQLYEALSSGSKDIENQEKAINDLAAAYESLGETATISAAKQKLAEESATKAAARELAQRQKELEEKTAAMNKQRGLEEEWNIVAIKTRSMADRQEAIAKRDAAQQRAEAYQREIDALKSYINYQEESARETKRFRERQEDDETEHQLRVDAIKAELAERDKKRKEEEQKTDKARQDAARKAQQEELALIKLREETAAKAFGASGAGSVERIEREYALRKQRAQEEFTDERKREIALAELEAQRVIDVEQTRAKVREELQARAAAATVGKGVAETEVQKAEQNWAQRRQSILLESQNLERLQQDYEREFTAAELAQSAEYADVKSREIAAAQELAAAQLKAYEQIDAARQLDLQREQEAIFNKVYAEKSLTKAQKEAASAASTAFNEMSAGLEAWGISSTAVQKAQMLASGIQAGADAIDYGARALAFFATGNAVAGTGMMAAAAGKTAAAAAYAAGVAGLGGAAPSTPSSPSSAGASSFSSSTLTGAGARESNEITVNFAFEGSDNQIASALIRGFNATAGSLGAQKIKKGVISSRV